MGFSNLYYSFLSKKFFIDLRRVDERIMLIDKFLKHDTLDFSAQKLSDREPLQMSVYASDSKSYSDAPEKSIAVISLKGDMMKEGTMCAYGTSEIAEQMNEAINSQNIEGIVLDIDSGGGAIDAIPPLLDAISNAKSKNKCVVALCDLCASAAYYVASYCDEIIASNTISAEFGSIGVMMSFADYAKYYEDNGIKVHTIYSDLSSYKNAPFESAKAGDYKAIKEEELNPLAKKFQNAVRSQRPNLDTKVEGILNGRTFFAEDAQKNGLIDNIGNMDFAVSECRKKCADAKISNYIKSHYDEQRV